MNLKRCANGHYYDSDKHPECPRCVQEGLIKAGAAPKQEQQPAQPEPVMEKPRRWTAGWLACIEGALEGNVYELKCGENTIGGTAEQDISLAADEQVAESCQMVIVYQPETRSFTASAGDSRELSYVNGQVVLCNVELHNRDILQVGGEKLMFIPLCGEDFAWDAEKMTTEGN